jgi:hypothetical protein
MITCPTADMEWAKHVFVSYVFHFSIDTWSKFQIMWQNLSTRSALTVTTTNSCQRFLKQVYSNCQQCYCTRSVSDTASVVMTNQCPEIWPYWFLWHLIAELPRHKNSASPVQLPALAPAWPCSDASRAFSFSRSLLTPATFRGTTLGFASAPTHATHILRSYRWASSCSCVCTFIR